MGQEEQCKTKDTDYDAQTTSGFGSSEGFLSFANELALLATQGMGELSFPRTLKTADSQTWN